MKHVSPAFRHGARVACLGAAVLLAGVAGLRAAGDKPTAADPTTAAATATTTCKSQTLAPTCCAGAAELSITDAAPKSACAETPTSAPAEAGMRAYLDPESGGVVVGMPNPAAGEVEAAQATAEPELQQEVLPDGSVMMHLQGTGVEYMVMEVDAKGDRTVRCVQDPTKALASTATAAKPEVK